jgi:hypothetical protein
MATATTRLALRKPDSDPVTGDNVDVDLDLNANNDKIDNAVGAFPCTSGTRPGTPWHGQIIRETDTGRLYVRNATDAAWDPIFVGRGTIAMAGASGATNAHMRWNLASGSIVTSYFMAAKQTADTFYRLGVAYDGYHEWGPGSGAADTNLYRGSAGLLQTDTMFRANAVTLAGNGASIGALAVSTGTDSTTSASYVNMAGTGSTTVVNYTKKYSASFTKMKVTMCGSLFVATSAATIDYGIRTNGADFQVGQLNIGTAANHHTIGGTIYVTGIAAGAQTFQARWRRVTGGGAPTRGTDDWLGIVVEEVSV